jgi:hypothetical protein
VALRPRSDSPGGIPHAFKAFVLGTSAPDGLFNWQLPGSKGIAMKQLLFGVAAVALVLVAADVALAKGMRSSDNRSNFNKHNESKHHDHDKYYSKDWYGKWCGYGYGSYCGYGCYPYYPYFYPYCKPCYPFPTVGIKMTQPAVVPGAAVPVEAGQPGPMSNFSGGVGQPGPMPGTPAGR